MIIVEPDMDPGRPAALVASIHAPWRATLAECLRRWSHLDHETRSGSYLVVEGDAPGVRRTLNAARMAELAAACEMAKAA